MLLSSKLLVFFVFGIVRQTVAEYYEDKKLGEISMFNRRR